MTTEARFIVWTGSEVEEWDAYSAFALRSHLTKGDQLPLCVDLKFDDPKDRYGHLTKTAWKSVPLEKFPKEFRMHLLLMGVP